MKMIYATGLCINTTLSEYLLDHFQDLINSRLVQLRYFANRLKNRCDDNQRKLCSLQYESCTALEQSEAVNHVIPP